MKFVINVRPQVVQARTIPDLITKISAGKHRAWSGYGANTLCKSDHRDRSEDVYYAYNVEKRRRKTSKVGVHGHALKNVRVIRQGHAIAHVYQFPVSFLNQFGLKIEQYHRTFRLIKQ